MSHVIYKNLNVEPIWAAGGDGVWIQDKSGRRYLDTCGGVAVSSLGHCHPRIMAAIAREAQRLSWVHAGSFTTSAAEELASILVKQSGGLAKAQFLSGGSEAMELSLKVAYQFHCESGESDRTIFISRRQSYHGSTLGTLAISGNRQRRAIFEPMLPLPRTEFVSPCYAYRDARANESDAAYADRLANELEIKILQVGSQRVAAFIAETVVGSTNGAVPAVPHYFKRIKEVCKKHGVLLILDEVMCGMGRTGLPYAYLEDGILPDIVAIGKGLAAGYQPISAILVSEYIHNTLANRSGVLLNGQTHVNHPLACAIALVVQQTIVQEDLLVNVRKRGEQLQALLKESFTGVEQVGDVRGRGLFVGVEFVESRKEKTPFRGGSKFVAALKNEALNHNLLIYPGSGTVDGNAGNHVLFAPPFIASESDISEIVGRFTEVVKHCLPKFITN